MCAPYIKENYKEEETVSAMEIICMHSFPQPSSQQRQIHLYCDTWILLSTDTYQNTQAHYFALINLKLNIQFCANTSFSLLLILLGSYHIFSIWKVLGRSEMENAVYNNILHYTSLSCSGYWRLQTKTHLMLYDQVDRYHDQSEWVRHYRSILVASITDMTYHHIISSERDRDIFLSHW